MKRLFVSCALVLAMFSCMKKQSDGTYRVTNPAPADTAKVKDNAAKAGEQVRQAAERVENSEAMKKAQEATREAGREVKRGVQKGLGKAAQAAGTKLHEVGVKVEEDAAKPATATTTTATTTTTTTTTTTRKTTRH